MGYQTIYKDIGIENEVTWGASNAGTIDRMHVRTSTLGQVANKSLVQQTMTSSKGYDSMVSAKNEVGGDLTGYGTPNCLHHAFELVNGSLGTTSAVGASAMLIDYYQNTSGTMISKAVHIDRNNSQEKFQGVVASSLELTFANEMLEWTLACNAKSVNGGAALSDTVGETVKPYAFEDFTVSISKGNTFNAAVTLPCSEFSVKYENGLEVSYLSGSASAGRVDPKIPNVSGKFKIFHAGSSWESAFQGCSEFYIRAIASTPSCKGLIAGITPYVLKIDVPRVQLTTNTRNYEQAALSVEDIEFTGMFDLGTSTLWKVSQTVGFDI